MIDQAENEPAALSLPQLDMLARVCAGPEFAVVAGLRGGDAKVLSSLVEGFWVEADFDGPVSGYRLTALGQQAIAEVMARAAEAAAELVAEDSAEGDGEVDAIDIHEQIAKHLDCIDALVAAAGEEVVTIAVSRRELATIIAGLRCWAGSFEQASSEKTDWPEWALPATSRASASRATAVCSNGSVSQRQFYAAVPFRPPWSSCVACCAGAPSPARE